MGLTGNTRVVQIHPTRRCNLRCLHCYSSSSPVETEMLKVELLCAAVSDAVAEGYNWVSLSGGEPLLYPALEQLLAHAKAAGMGTAVVSNGMLLSPRRLDRLAPVLDLCVLSIDGIPASHNHMRGSTRAFELMASHLTLLRERRVRFGFLFTLTQHNLHELPWVIDFALTQGASLLQVHPLEAAGAATQHLVGSVPDKVEAAYAWALREQMYKTLGERLPMQIDLVYSKFVQNHPERFYATPEPAHADICLGEVISPLVIEPDAVVVPLRYGFPRTFALGTLHQASLRTLARHWRTQGCTALQAVCREAYRHICQQTTPYFLNWYEMVSKIAADQEAQWSHTAPEL
ncbi:MAG TPA: radical SAM protein [Candidatus Tectomicrobia bacterium]